MHTARRPSGDTNDKRLSALLEKRGASGRAVASVPNHTNFRIEQAGIDLASVAAIDELQTKKSASPDPPSIQPVAL